MLDIKPLPLQVLVTRRYRSARSPIYGRNWCICRPPNGVLIANLAQARCNHVMDGRIVEVVNFKARHPANGTDAPSAPTLGLITCPPLVNSHGTAFIGSPRDRVQLGYAVTRQTSPRNRQALPTLQCCLLRTRTKDKVGGIFGIHVINLLVETMLLSYSDTNTIRLPSSIPHQAKSCVSSSKGANIWSGITTNKLRSLLGDTPMTFFTFFRKTRNVIVGRTRIDWLMCLSSLIRSLEER